MSLEQLRAKRRKWVEANQENGFEEGINNLLTQLYPDNAHFIYELLQNAEDPRATVVRFKLTNSEVTFEHNGTRLFTLKDVDSITSIGASTKRDDPTSIGKFGVGFKAVFAYTNTPEIHSGDFHFRIHDLVVPVTDGVPQVKMGELETCFVFPFDNPKKPKKQAVAEVERGLRALGANTLMFLSHIRKIEYLLPDGTLGSLERIEHDDGRIEIHAETSTSHWLRFQKNVEVEDESGKRMACRIAIAYQLVSRDDKRIFPLQAGQVSIYFPADKETSNLRFHIHAPFASTVARDSVRDCEANCKLRDHIANLVAESLIAIRNQGMLTVGFLAVLPNPQDSLSDFYNPIREAIVQAFKEESLTPMKQGGHAAANSIFKGPASISDVIGDDDLVLLLGDDYEAPMWVSNPPQRNQREDKFLESLDIDEWGWSELVSVLDDCCYDDEQRERVETWITSKDDIWLMRFYALLGEACDLHNECVDVSELSIVRIEAPEEHLHVIPKSAFFPPEQEVEPPAGIHFVKPTVYSIGRSEAQKKSARSFLSNIGVRPFDEKAAIELMLAHYAKPPTQVTDSHYSDLKQFIAYWKNNPTSINIFKGNFLIGTSSDGRLLWSNPSKLCIDSPYRDTGLSGFTNIHNRHVIWSSYKSKLNELQIRDFVGFLHALGVMQGLSVESVSIYTNPERQALWADLYGTRETYTGIHEDYSIAMLESYLNLQSIHASRLVWHALIRADQKVSKARYRPNQQYRTREVDSQLVCHLKSHAWIPDTSGVFRKPQDMTKESLPTDFPYDDRNGLLTAIGFGENAKKRTEEYKLRNRDAQHMGFESVEVAEEIARLLKGGVTLEKIRTLASQRTEQPKQSVPDPERRRRNVLDNVADAPSKESVLRERAIQKGISEVTAQARAYLRAKYSNADGQLVCQCCHEEMPFKLSSGEHYFEAVQCVGEKDKETRYFQNRLALCPTCAAMYRHARETDDIEIHRRILDLTADDVSPSVEIQVQLAGREHTLHFVGTHWFDLKTVLSAHMATS